MRSRWLHALLGFVVSGILASLLLRSVTIRPTEESNHAITDVLYPIVAPPSANGTFHQRNESMPKNNVTFVKLAKPREPKQNSSHVPIPSPPTSPSTTAVARSTSILNQWANETVTTPSVYICHDAGEAYSAAFLVAKEPFLKHRYGVSHRQHMETGGTVYGRKLLPYKTVDMMEFGVEHLSWLERRLGMQTLPTNLKRIALDDLMESLRQRQRILAMSASRRHPSVSNDIIAIMPFFSGGSGDAGHSVPELRQLYLNITFLSFSLHVRDVAVCVCTSHDAEFLRSSGLPWYEVIEEDCHIKYPDQQNASNGEIKFKPSLLGVLTARAAQARMSNGNWTHKYLFYTESDQVLFVRNLASMVQFANTSRYIAPHRMLPMPTRRTFVKLGPQLNDVSRLNPAYANLKHAQKELERNSGRVFVQAETEHQAGCCFDRGPCKTRDHWKTYTNSHHSSLFRFMVVGDSFPLMCGEGNFLRMHFRICADHAGTPPCP